MEVLNPSPVLCLPQAMWIIHRVIMTKPDLGQDLVLDLVTPETMREAAPQRGAHARRALAGLKEFGMVREVDGLLTAEQVKDAHGFLRLLRRRLVVPPESLGPDFRGAPDLRSALIWLMRQSPFVPLHYEVNVQTNMPEGLFTNDTRWNGFRFWSQALGFGLESLKRIKPQGSPQDDRVEIVPNPTFAVIDAIQEPFGDPLPRGVQISIDEFIGFLRFELPVLPGHPSATYQGFIEEGKQAIASLGLALATAEQLKLLTMDYQSDPSGVLALPDARNNGQDRYVSNVVIRK